MATNRLELPLGNLHFGNVDVEEADGIAFELLPFGFVALESGRREMPWRCRQPCNDERITWDRRLNVLTLRTVPAVPFWQFQQSLNSQIDV
jgi:hypothetical protein